LGKLTIAQPQAGTETLVPRMHRYGEHLLPLAKDKPKGTEQHLTAQKTAYKRSRRLFSNFEEEVFLISRAAFSPLRSHFLGTTEL